MGIAMTASMMAPSALWNATWRGPARRAGRGAHEEQDPRENEPPNPEDRGEDAVGNVQVRHGALEIGVGGRSPVEHCNRVAEAGHPAARAPPWGASARRIGRRWGGPRASTVTGWPRRGTRRPARP